MKQLLTPKEKLLKVICQFLEIDDCDCVTCKKAKTTMLDSILQINIEEKIELLYLIKAFPSVIDNELINLQNELKQL